MRRRRKKVQMMHEYKNIDDFITALTEFLNHDRLRDFIYVVFDDETGEIILDSYIEELAKNYHEPAPEYKDENWTDEEEEAIYAWIKRAEEAILKEVDTRNIVSLASHKRFIEITRQIYQVAFNLCKDLMITGLSSGVYGRGAYTMRFTLVMGKSTFGIVIQSNSVPRCSSFDSTELHFLESDSEAVIRKLVLAAMENAKE